MGQIQIQFSRAVDTLAHQVWANQRSNVVTIVEFARSNISAALREFGDDVLSRAQIIYLEASPERRRARLQARATPPKLQVVANSVTIAVSDDHLLPSVAVDCLYNVDDYEALRHNRTLDGRIHRVVNNTDQTDDANSIKSLTAFVECVIAPYMTDPRPQRGSKRPLIKALRRAS